MPSKVDPQDELRHWPESVATQLDDLIATHAHKGQFACFDMDDTSWQFDLESSLLPFLENKGVISRDTMDPSLKLIPFKDSPDQQESLFSYSQRLYHLGDSIYYSFSSQIFSGISLRDLKTHVDELMDSTEPISTNYYQDDTLTTVEVHPPKIFRGQVELYNKLTTNGIDVYVITASSEELVRMVASDPKYGYNVKPENVIGTTLLMKNLKSGEITTSRKQIADGTYSEKAIQNAAADLVMTPYVWTPATWMIGKWAAILSYIDEWKKPILVAGDSPVSDTPMLFHGANVEKGGMRLWISRTDACRQNIGKLIKEAAQKQEAEGLAITADKNWLFVTPEDIL